MCRVHVRQLALGLALAPLALWIVVVSLFPTRWLRDGVEREVERVIDRPVSLAGVRIGVLGELRLTGLAVGEPADPWLLVDKAELDARLWEGLWGRVALERLRVRGMRLRVQRRVDGSFDLGEPSTRFASSNEDAKAGGAGVSMAATSDAADGISIELAESEVTLVDERSDTSLKLEDVEGRARFERGRLEVEDLRGTHGHGVVRLAGILESRPGGWRFESELQAEAVELDQELGALAYVLPLVAGARGELDGRLDLEMRLRGGSAGGHDLAESLEGEGAVTVSGVELSRSPLIEELSRLFEFSPAGRVGSIAGRFAVADQRVSTQAMTIRVGSFPLEVEGWTDFDGTIDYTVRCLELSRRLTELSERLPPKARTLLAELEGRRGLDRVRDLRLTGTLERMRLSPAATAARTPLPDARRVRR
jgi:AsmA protein